MDKFDVVVTRLYRWQWWFRVQLTGCCVLSAMTLYCMLAHRANQSISRNQDIRFAYRSTGIVYIYLTRRTLRTQFIYSFCAFRVELINQATRQIRPFKEKEKLKCTVLEHETGTHTHTQNLRLNFLANR